MQAVTDQGEGAAIPRLGVRNSAAFHYTGAAMLLGSVVASLWWQDPAILMLPLPVVLLAWPVLARFLGPDNAMELEESGVRLQDGILAYQRIGFARLGGPAAGDFVHFHGVDGGLLRSVPLKPAARGLADVYDQGHLDFVVELNRRVRNAGNPGIC